MIFRSLIALMLLTTLVACSSYDDEESYNETQPGVEVATDDQLFEEEAASDFLDENAFVEEPAGQQPKEPMAQDAVPMEEDKTPDVAAAVEKTMEPTRPVQAGPMMEYTVKDDETLMLIAFKLYGDYRKWRTIAQHNSETIKDGQTVVPGMVLQYPAPQEEFVWSPSGEPYLIKWGDTLGKISDSVYGTMRRWKDLWENNRPLIKDPDKIYAGFTIYYVPDNKELALNQ